MHHIIAHILNKMDYGGIEGITTNYYNHLNHNNVQYDFYLYEGSEFPQRRELENADAGIYLIPSYSRVFKYYHCLKRHFKETHYKIVQTDLNTMSFIALLAAEKAGVPIRICNNLSTGERSEGVRYLIKCFLRPLCKSVATHYIACGEEAGKWMYGKKDYDSGKVKIFPNAIDTASFKFDGEVRRRIRDFWNIPEDAVVIGNIARVTHQKNQKFILMLFSDMLQENQNLYLFLVGDGDMMGEIQMLAEPIKDRVIFAGYQKDVHEFYSAMDMFLLPSLYEGMPIVAWEAQANGLSCVFSNNVTREAGKLSSCAFLDLDAPLDCWKGAIYKAIQNRMKEYSEAEVTAIPNISYWGKQLENYYLQLLEDSEKNESITNY